MAEGKAGIGKAKENETQDGLGMRFSRVFLAESLSAGAIQCIAGL